MVVAASETAARVGALLPLPPVSGMTICAAMFTEPLETRSVMRHAGSKQEREARILSARACFAVSSKLEASPEIVNCRSMTAAAISTMVSPSLKGANGGTGGSVGVGGGEGDGGGGEGDGGGGEGEGGGGEGGDEGGDGQGTKFTLAFTYAASIEHVSMLSMCKTIVLPPSAK